MGLQPHVVAGAIRVGRRFEDPVNVDPDQVEDLAHHYGHFGGIDAVGTENRAAAALSALVKVHEPFFQDINGEVTGPDHFTHDLAGLGELAPVDGTEEFGPEDRHILGITGAKKKVTLVGAGPATDTTVHEDLEATKFIKPLAQALKDDLLPVLGKFPVLVLGAPDPRLPELAGKGLVEILDNLRLAGITIITGFKYDRGVHPACPGNGPGHQGRVLGDANT